MDGRNKFPCAVCKHHRKKCPVDCIFKPHLPGDNPALYDLLRPKYRTDELRQILEGLSEHDRSNTFRILVDGAMATQEPKIDSPSLTTQRQKIDLPSDIIQEQKDADRFNICMQFQQEIEQRIKSQILSSGSERRKETEELNRKLDMLTMKMDKLSVQMEMLNMKMDKLSTGTASNSCIEEPVRESFEWNSVINWEMPNNSFLPAEGSPAHPIPAEFLGTTGPRTSPGPSQTLGPWPG